MSLVALSSIFIHFVDELVLQTLNLLRLLKQKIHKVLFIQLRWSSFIGASLSFTGGPWCLLSITDWLLIHTLLACLLDSSVVRLLKYYYRFKIALNLNSNSRSK